MIAKQREEFLQNLALRAEVAGDLYYVSMDKQSFDKAMKGCEQEEFYKQYLRQREIGEEAYKNEVKSEIEGINSSQELDFLMKDYNYDGGNFLLEQVILHPLCDIQTAKAIYWLCEPSYYYDSFGSLQGCLEDDVNFKDATLLIKIEEKAKNQGFKTDLEPKDDENVLELISEVNFNALPYANIPNCLR